MSFVEKHKAWLLPVLALGVAGVVYMNVKTLSKPPAPASRPSEAPNQGPAPAPAPAPAAAPTAVPPRPAGPEGELWADLRTLEAPWPALNQSEEVMRRSERPLEADASSAQPVFHPDRWARLPKPKVLVPPPVIQGPAAPAPRLVPPPPVAFVGNTPSGPVAWIEGKPWQEGAVLPGGYRLKRILLDRVVLEGPAGLEERALVQPPKEGPRSTEAR